MDNPNVSFQRGFNIMMQIMGMKQQKDQAELRANRQQKALQMEEQRLALEKKRATIKEQEFKNKQEINALKAAEIQAFGKRPDFGPDPNVLAGPSGRLQGQSPVQQMYGQFAPYAMMQLTAGKGLPQPPGYEAKEKAAEKAPTQLETGKYASQLRKEFDASKVVKDYDEINFRYGIMNEAMKESKKTKNFVAVDQAIITTFNKMTDPTSVVRESEYVRTAQDLAMWNRLKGKIARFKAGGPGLTPSDREALFSMAKKFMTVAESKYQTQKQRYTGFFTEAGLDPKKHFFSESITAPKPIPRQDISSMSDEDIAKELARIRGQL